MTLKNLSLAVMPALLLMMLAGCMPAEDEVGAPAPEIDWSKIVGPDYDHRDDCEATITNRLALDGAAPPVPPDATTGADNLACAWDVFAWNSFAALNWPANTALGKRGLPSTSATFLGNQDSAAEVVWESFKEKRELFQDDPSPHWNDIASGQEVKSFQKPANLWTQNGGYCTPADQARAGTAASGPFAANKFHNQLDETAEVQSQALEPLSDLCKGKKITGYNAANEPECGIDNESVVGPRVWLGKPADGRPLYYEVKVNYDFFDYVMNPPDDMALPAADSTLVDDEVAATNALFANIRLPWRSAAPPTKTANQNAVFNYGSNGCDPMTGEPESGVAGASVPCRSGAIHMKAAWVRLTDDEIAQDPQRYHTTTALFYETPEEGKTCIAVDTFGLLGLHAIQRVKTEATDQKGEKSPSNPGGAFIFATWEHRSILDPTYDEPRDFSYVNLLTNPTFGSTEAGDPYPALADALPVTRMIPPHGDASAQTTCGLSAEQTCQVNAAAHDLLGDSVWSNYRLVGTQFSPNDCSFTEGSRKSEEQQLGQCRYQTLSALGQPHFLANAVIETNQGLQHFLGLPPEQPRLQPPTWCAPAATNDKYCDDQGARLIGPNTSRVDADLAFARGVHNMTYQGGPVNMGGCQGCHGIAQQNGFSFSFVLLDGVGGGGADTEKDAEIPATAIAQSVPLRLRSITDPSKYLAIGGPSPFENFNELVLSDRAGATQWTLQPYTNDPGFANFGGELILAEVGGNRVLQLGQTAGFTSAGTKNSALAGPINSGSSSRAVEQQSVFLVKYKGPAPTGVEVTQPFSLVSVSQTDGATHYVLQADTASGQVSAQPPAAIPSGSTTSAALEAQVFDLEVVTSGG